MEQTSDDRLSSLPDPIICHILSFMSTKNAARTSVLSTRWEKLFLYVPNLVFNDYIPLFKQGKTYHEDFVNFVNRRLLLSKTPFITEFRLTCLHLSDSGIPISLWIASLLCRKVEVLDIYEMSSNSLRPPREFFRSETLRIVKLSGMGIELKFPESVSFPKLKVLHLENMVMQSHSDRIVFGRGYPVLEDLKLVDIVLQGSISMLKISVSSLKTLEIKEDTDGIKQFAKVWIDIGAHNLEHIKCNLFNYQYVSLRRCESIVSAHIYQQTGNVILPANQSNLMLLYNLNHVKELHMSKGFLENFTPYGYTLLKFPYLTNLELTATGGTMWNLLQRAPALKALVYNVESVGSCLVPETVPVSVGNSLREIIIKGFKGGVTEGVVVRYLMLHAAVLKKMTIELKGCGIQELPPSILKLLIGQTRRSPTCRIEIMERCS